MRRYCYVKYTARQTGSSTLTSRVSSFHMSSGQARQSWWALLLLDEPDSGSSKLTSPAMPSKSYVFSTKRHLSRMENPARLVKVDKPLTSSAHQSWLALPCRCIPILFRTLKGASLKTTFHFVWAWPACVSSSLKGARVSIYNRNMLCCSWITIHYTHKLEKYILRGD